MKYIRILFFKKGVIWKYLVIERNSFIIVFWSQIGQNYSYKLIRNDRLTVSSIIYMRS